MIANNRSYKIVYCVPALYMAGGVERVLTLKANYFATYYGYKITFILTEGTGHPLFYPLSKDIQVINLGINFEELWTCSFFKKIFVYLKKQRRFKKKLTCELMRIRPDITISMLRRDINFIMNIKDGSKKIGELHVNRANFRNFEPNDTNLIKSVFARFWIRDLIRHLRKLDKLVILTQEDKLQWNDLDNVVVIPNPLSFHTDVVSPLVSKRVIAVGRYVYQKGFDLLLQAWSIIEKENSDWELSLFGQGNRQPYERMMDEMGLDKKRCHLNGPVNNICQEYLNSSLIACSSRFEGFGMVIIEAMACGLGVVSFDCPCGPKDIISNGTDGYLVPNGDVSLLAKQLLYLMQHPEDIKRLSEGAVKKSRMYSLDAIASQWKKLFESII